MFLISFDLGSYTRTSIHSNACYLKIERLAGTVKKPSSHNSSVHKKVVFCSMKERQMKSQTDGTTVLRLLVLTNTLVVHVWFQICNSNKVTYLNSQWCFIEFTNKLPNKTRWKASKIRLSWTNLIFTTELPKLSETYSKQKQLCGSAPGKVQRLTTRWFDSLQKLLILYPHIQNWLLKIVV